MQLPGVLPIQHGDAIEPSPPAAQARSNENTGEHKELGSRAGRPHETKSDQGSAPPESPDAGTDVGASDRVEHAIDTGRPQGAYGAIESILRAPAAMEQPCGL